MISRAARLVIAPLLCLGLCACAVTPVRPPAGLLYTQLRAPITTDFESTRVGTKRGISTAYWVWEPFLGTNFGWGAADVEEAARAGRIREVTHLDYEMTVVLFLFQRFRVIAYGE